MRKFMFKGAALMLVTFFLVSGCKKEDVCHSCTQTNKAPVAMAGPDQVITSPLNSVILSGQGSQDPDGSIRQWQWRRLDAGHNASMQHPDSSQTVVTDLTKGVYRFELTVTDNHGVGDKDTVRVFVDIMPASNHSPIAYAGPDQASPIPIISTTLDGSGSSDPDDNLKSYMWSKISGPASIIVQGSANVQAIVHQLSAGIYTFQLLVTDAEGLSDRDTMQIIVSPYANDAPSANAGADQVITLPVNMVQLNGYSSTDPENNIVMYGWKQIAGPALGTNVDSGPYIQVSNLLQGLYIFELTVTDHGGLSSRDTMKVTVNGLPTRSPAIFDNMYWVNNCVLKIPNIYSFIPPGNNLHVELKRYDYQGEASQWVTVRMQGLHLPADFAYYTIENGTLIVYGMNMDCGFDDAQSYSIKINY